MNRFPSTARTTLSALAVGIVFTLSSLPYLPLAPRSDSLSTLWMLRNSAPWEWMLDPRIGGFNFIFFFEPGFGWITYPALWLTPLIGDAGHHMAALAGALLLGAVTGLLTLDATNSRPAAMAACVLLLFSTPVWYDIADTSMSHYLFATAFALLSLRFTWRAQWVPRRDCERLAWSQSLASAFLYFVALCFKESVGALPALILVLHLMVFRRPVAALLFLVPHTIALALFLFWHHHMLGGQGGYFLEAEWLPSNWITAVPVVGYALWGHAAVTLVLAAALAWLRPTALAMVVFAWAVGVAPFAFAGPFGPHPFSAGRLLLPIALSWALFVAAALRRWRLSGRYGRAGFALAAATLLALQWSQRPQVPATYARLQPTDALPKRPWVEPLAVVSEQWTAPMSLHQLQPEPRAPFVSYRTSIDRQLDRALGRRLPPGTRVIPETDPGPTPMLVPLPADAVSVGFDRLGRVHIRLSTSAVGHFWLALDYQNGPTRFVASFPIQRARVDLPLARSIRRLVVFEPGPTSRWPARVLEAPAFVDPWPRLSDSSVAPAGNSAALQPLR